MKQLQSVGIRFVSLPVGSVHAARAADAAEKLSCPVGNVKPSFLFFSLFFLKPSLRKNVLILQNFV
jgi:hypothetical protein